MAEAALNFHELFDSQFMKSLQRLRLRARRAVRMGRYAQQRSKDPGHGLEFKDFRPYIAGDDLRSVDWNIYRRLGKLVVKVFEEQKDLPLYLLPDVSASMFMEQPPRIHAAQRAALAVAAVSLGQHDSVGLFPFAEDLQIRVKSKSGKSSLMLFAQHLSELTARRDTHISVAIRHFCSLQQCRISKTARAGRSSTCPSRPTPCSVIAAPMRDSARRWNVSRSNGSPSCCAWIRTPMCSIRSPSCSTRVSC